MIKENRKLSKGTVLDHDVWEHPNLAVTCALVTKRPNGKLAFLTQTRGEGAADFKGSLCFACGYYDFKDHYVRLAAARELYEETGYQVDPGELKFAGISDGLHTNLGNITLRFVAWIETPKDHETVNNERGGENDEVSGLTWYDLDWIQSNKEKFCFTHDSFAQEIADNLDRIMAGGYYMDRWDQEKPERDV
jgi:8-oxo-dGTP pyrophosphatase MutT (NUDIX family)